MVCDKGSGAALMMREKRLHESLQGISAALIKCPLTIKMRTGWDEKKPFAHELVAKIQSWGIPSITAVMVHGRSRLQRYSKEADWDYVRKIVASQDESKPVIPIIGNGDIMSYTDYEEKVEKSEGLVSCAMLARGALIKPWLPTEIKERRHWDISATERLDILKDFVRFGLLHWGSDQQGVNNCRRFLLEWLSFLHRYVPVAFLEQPGPQKMNQRPPKFMCGRSDLETLLMSDQSSDWIKISEMLLGPVPDGFRFEPKHKANSYRSE
jgi:tRNA-dihydrouridine synthase 3